MEIMKWAYVLIGAGVVILGAVGGYVFWPHASHSPVSSITRATIPVTATAAPAVTSLTAVIATTTNSHSGMKFYRNDQYGFSFWYPQDWTLYENSFTNPNSIFNVTADPEGHYMGFGVNVTPSSFAKKAEVGEKPIATTTIDGIKTNEYAYQFEGETEASFDVSRGNIYVLIIGHPIHIPNFDQIVHSFKFFSTSTTSTSS